MQNIYLLALAGWRQCHREGCVHRSSQGSWEKCLLLLPERGPVWTKALCATASLLTARKIKLRWSVYAKNTHVNERRRHSGEVSDVLWVQILSDQGVGENSSVIVHTWRRFNFYQTRKYSNSRLTIYSEVVGNQFFGEILLVSDKIVGCQEELVNYCEIDTLMIFKLQLPPFIRTVEGENSFVLDDGHQGGFRREITTF